ncbi:hypothetical protein L1987_39891 [Smallanthus sonchifolius]|uniref:Uncharacterized protein n=1 Tax=Smallanthus sonchifolius TaxID=185202 RepID=A0ACB9GTC5_9ASTR|nr:hypothetical protein L1987_39891 [Smallanthus sonchifolius]
MGRRLGRPVVGIAGSVGTGGLGTVFWALSPSGPDEVCWDSSHSPQLVVFVVCDWACKDGAGGGVWAVTDGAIDVETVGLLSPGNSSMKFDREELIPP